MSKNVWKYQDTKQILYIKVIQQKPTHGTVAIAIVRVAMKNGWRQIGAHKQVHKNMYKNYI